MPVIKTGPRITHLYRQLKSGQPPAFDNDDLSVIGDTAETRIIASIATKDAQLKPWHSRYQDGKVAFGYRPFGLTITGCGFVLAVFAAIGVLFSFIDKSLSDFFTALFFLLLGLWMMWYGSFAPYRRFIIFDRANALVHVSSRLCRQRYLSLRWQDVTFVNGHWLLPDPYKTRPKPTYDIKLVMPPTTLQRMGVVSYKLQGQPLYGAANQTEGMNNTTVRCTSSDPIWRFIVLFMCHGPHHHPVMQDYIDTEHRIRDYFHNGCWKTMLKNDLNDQPFWGRQMSRFRMPELPDTPTHIVDSNGKWRKLKQDERAAHKTGPRWEHIKPEHDAILR